jgi:hypothetical protein
MTFAYYVPDDYSGEIFKNKTEKRGEKEEFVPLELNGLFVCPIELWGKPDYVENGIEVHNNMLKSIVSENKYQKLYFFDMEKQITKSPEIFRDLCHFTYKGSAEFVTRIMPIVIQVSNKLE